MGARIVFIGDDFTGASDSLATYERAGMRARMVLGAAGKAEQRCLRLAIFPTVSPHTQNQGAA